MPEKKTREKNGDAEGKLIPLLVVSCAVSVALGLGLVLISIERTDLGYSMRNLEGLARNKADHANELEVERERLLSPYTLEKKAAELGMRVAKPGQIRRMDGATLQNPAQ